jgi:hypothetical protein
MSTVLGPVRRERRCSVERGGDTWWREAVAPGRGRRCPGLTRRGPREDELDQAVVSGVEAGRAAADGTRGHSGGCSRVRRRWCAEL